MLWIALVALATVTRAAEPAGPPALTVYMISGATCPHCAEAREHFDALRARHPGVVVEEIEIWENRDNRPRARALAARAGAEFGAVPLIIIGDRHWIGFRADPIGTEIDAAIAACLAAPCIDLGRADAVVTTAPRPAQVSTRIDLPLLGTIDLGSQSLLVSTALIAFVDGFNACSLWVLSLLLAITLHSGRRGRVLLIGLLFLTVSSAIYALFIAGIVTAT
jgi:glutaredoxin